MEPEIYDNYDLLPRGKDYVLKIKVRNGPLLRALRMRGHKSILGFCRATGFSLPTIYRYLSLASAPISRKGWKPSALKLAALLRLPPDSLWPEQHLETALKASSGEIEVSQEEVELLINRAPRTPEQKLIEEQLHETILDAIGSLSPREQKVIKARFGFDEESQTLRQVGDELGVSPTRIQMIEAKALRKLRKRGKQLRNAGYGDPALEL